MGVIPRPHFIFFSIAVIDLFFGLRRPHALLENVLEVEIEVELQILWLLLQPRVLFLLPGASLEDEGIEAENAHHLLHVLRGVGRTQRGTSDGGRGLYAVAGEGSGGLDDKRGIDGFRFYADIVPLVLDLVPVGFIWSG